MKITSIIAGALAIGVGIAVSTVDVWSNVEFIAGDHIKSPADLTELANWNSNMAAVVAIAIASFGALGGAMTAFRLRAPFIACGLLLSWVCAAAFSLSATLDRAGSQRDAAIHAKASHNVGIERVEKGIATQRGIIAAQEEIAAAECKGYIPARHKAADWPNCIAARSAIAKAIAEIARLEEKLTTLGAEVTEDSMGTRIAAMLPFLTPAQVSTYQPVTMPLALFGFGQFFAGLGFLIWSSQITPAAARPVTIEAHVLRDVTPSDPVLAAIPDGRAVSNRQLAARLGLSEATASRRVRELQRAGLIAVERNGRSKAIRRLS